MNTEENEDWFLSHFYDFLMNNTLLTFSLSSPYLISIKNTFAALKSKWLPL